MVDRVRVEQMGQLKIVDMETGRESASFPAAAASIKPDEGPPSSSSSTSSADVDDQPLREPHGVCADDHGLIFVADRRAHAVRVFDERCGLRSGTTGRSLASFDNERHGVGRPFAVACNRQGLLAIADYVGTVRVYRYLAETDSDREQTS